MLIQDFGYEFIQSDDRLRTDAMTHWMDIHDDPRLIVGPDHLVVNTDYCLALYNAADNQEEIAQQYLRDDPDDITDDFIKYIKENYL